MVNLISEPNTYLDRAYLTSTRSRDELIVADGLCPQIAELLSNTLHDSVSLKVVGNPLTSITETLATRHSKGHTVQTLHIVAHGRPGAFLIGDQWVDSAFLIANAESISQWQVERIALWNGVVAPILKQHCYPS